ncbi:MAG: N-acetylmannosamine-6-phosphate 2-epimerase [Hydrococcus sp. C42_A2020_068]|uniref:N-acetylmannosamine-6-phosphate 2-epimerase n=1 Tax=Pleurocapsa sp. PCC 7327 TaxID=118163 RepID=UPI00029FF8BC|nr:N-acetylmannosamine-6-phosphate 2-epimerase [Pleurocapsa sp. PCC 7327]AFY77105.1 putative N-acetylmannosamine-6-phosphate epimerase [Pleurocapsa sp. PCC 7327]MBF2019389.1 N-acetylmannosamine-6-phosphate 2-epimerase [Hydrococcus sp. C42_A2020_068]
MNIETLKNSLIVSCQAPIDSPLHDPKIIAAMAKASVMQGAAGVRIDTPAHIEQVRQQMPDISIIGLWKKQFPKSEVYITPRFEEAIAIARAGADIIAIDATRRERPERETVSEIIEKIHTRLDKLVMADIDTIESAIAAAEAGADLVATTLYGYTPQTQHLSPPGYSLLTEIVEKLQIPVIGEGGISSPEDAKKALDLGAFAVVVGTAITGIDLKVKAFKAVFG